MTLHLAFPASNVSQRRSLLTFLVIIALPSFRIWLRRLGVKYCQLVLRYHVSTFCTISNADLHMIYAFTFAPAQGPTIGKVFKPSPPSVVLFWATSFFFLLFRHQWSSAWYFSVRTEKENLIEDSMLLYFKYSGSGTNTSVLKRSIMCRNAKCFWSTISTICDPDYYVSTSIKPVKVSKTKRATEWIENLIHTALSCSKRCVILVKGSEILRTRGKSVQYKNRCVAYMHQKVLLHSP